MRKHECICFDVLVENVEAFDAKLAFLDDAGEGRGGVFNPCVYVEWLEGLLAVAVSDADVDFDDNVRVEFYEPRYCCGSDFGLVPKN